MTDEEPGGTDAEISRIKALVEGILRKHPETVNSDKKLLYWCWVQAHPEFAQVLTPEEFVVLPNFESIRRCRQSFNERGQFLPTDPEVFRKRRLREEDFRRIFGRGWDG